MKNFDDYYNKQFAASVETGSIYEPFTVLLNAAHETRMELLARLDIGDTQDKVIVDFGTGSWGFGCIYPRLHKCKLAIGIDISSEAIAISEKISREGNFAYENRYKYFVSNGLTIPLETNSVDIFFTGECIEHVENTDAFLDEIHRVLKPDGLLILTTPNPSPLLYRATGIEFAVGPEHIALMDYRELSFYLNPRFEVLTWQGYNLTVHPDIDSSITSQEFAYTWANSSIDCPQDASGFIVMARARSNYHPSAYSKETYKATSDIALLSGNWTEMRIHAGLSAYMGKAGCEVSFDFTGEQIIVLLWMHDWSGIVEVDINSRVEQYDLYSRFGGFRRLVFKELGPGLHKLSIRPTGGKNEKSHDDQVLFFSASAYTKHLADDPFTASSNAI